MFISFSEFLISAARSKFNESSRVVDSEAGKLLSTTKKKMEMLLSLIEIPCIFNRNPMIRVLRKRKSILDDFGCLRAIDGEFHFRLFVFRRDCFRADRIGSHSHSTFNDFLLRLFLFTLFFLSHDWSDVDSTKTHLTETRHAPLNSFKF